MKIIFFQFLKLALVCIIGLYNPLRLVSQREFEISAADIDQISDKHFKLLMGYEILNRINRLSMHPRTFITMQKVHCIGLAWRSWTAATDIKQESERDEKKNKTLWIYGNDNNKHECLPPKCLLGEAVISLQCKQRKLPGIRMRFSGRFSHSTLDRPLRLTLMSVSLWINVLE